MRYNENGWIFQEGKMQNITKHVTQKELEDLIDLVEQEEKWQNCVQEEMQNSVQRPLSGQFDFFRSFTLSKNAAGVVRSMPYGDMVSFPSARHLFRGVNKKHSISIPSLNRAPEFQGKSRIDQAIYRGIANMRIQQFCEFIWQIHLIPYWTGTICDINYLALAQHYGFQTHLMDLTNDFKSALFFATCAYEYETDSYRPLTMADINKNAESAQGVIFHTPDWMLDFDQPMGAVMLGEKLMQGMKPEIIRLDSGLFDGFAFQIGVQPLQRCHHQSGYLLPMRDDAPLQHDKRFEKLIFDQTPEFSRKVFDMMEKGKKVFPQEGINKALPILRQMQKARRFSKQNLKGAFESGGIDRDLFTTEEAFEDEIRKRGYEIVAEPIVYENQNRLLDVMNVEYDPVDIDTIIGRKIYMREDYRIRREQIYKMLFGEHGD